MPFVIVEDGRATRELSNEQVTTYIKRSLNMSIRNFRDLPQDVRQELRTKLEARGCYWLTQVDDPEFDPATHKLGPTQIVQRNGRWFKGKEKVELSASELAEADTRAQRQYENDLTRTVGLQMVLREAGEATQQDVLDAIAAVKALHGKA